MNAHEVFAAVGDRKRLRLLSMLAAGELCVCELTAATGAPQPTISRQLGLLRKAGLVTTRREGRWMHYALARGERPLQRGVLKLLRSLKETVPASARRRC